MKKLKNLLLFVFGLMLIFAINEFVFLNNQILVETQATTGADFKVVVGKEKLNFQTNKYVKNMNCSEVMLVEDKLFQEFLSNNNKVFSNGDYILLEYKITGVKQSDNPQYHPLIMPISWKIIGLFEFFAFLLLEILTLIFVLSYFRNKL